MQDPFGPARSTDLHRSAPYEEHGSSQNHRPWSGVAGSAVAATKVARPGDHSRRLLPPSLAPRGSCSAPQPSLASRGACSRAAKMTCSPQGIADLDDEQAYDEDQESSADEDSNNKFLGGGQGEESSSFEGRAARPSKDKDSSLSADEEGDPFLECCVPVDADRDERHDERPASNGAVASSSSARGDLVIPKTRPPLNLKKEKEKKPTVNSKRQLTCAQCLRPSLKKAHTFLEGCAREGESPRGRGTRGVGTRPRQGARPHWSAQIRPDLRKQLEKTHGPLPEGAVQEVVGGQTCVKIPVERLVPHKRKWADGDDVYAVTE